MADRELIDTGNDKRYVRRDDNGRFKESDDVGRSLTQDRRKGCFHEGAKGSGRSRRPLGDEPPAPRRRRLAK